MPDSNNFRKKFLVPTIYCAVVAMALWSGTSMVSNFSKDGGRDMSLIAPAAGDEIKNISISSDELMGFNELPPIPSDPDSTQGNLGDASELPPLRISPDKPEIIQLDRDAVNVLVGSEETLRAVPDTNRTIVLIPKKPGATFFKATDAEGKVIMQRHVIVGVAEKNNAYLRIRRACAPDDSKCQQFSVYYCPDMCHEVSVVQGDRASGASATTPDVAPSIDTTGTDPEYVEPSQPLPAQ